LRKLLAKSLAIFGLLPCFLYSGQGPEVKNGPVTTRLVTESNVKPESSSFEIGWWIKREKGWHTYWESPGDVGVPPTLKWNLPEGIILREMHYAPPQLVKMFKVFAHGHKDESLFIFRFDVKRKLQHGDELSFGAKASWLACFTTCLPSYDNLEITIPVQKDAEIDNRWHPYFRDFREKQPVSPPSGWLSRCNAEILKEKKGEKEFVIFRFPWDENGPLPLFRFFGDGRFIRSNIFQIPKKIFEQNGKQMVEVSMELSYWRDPDQKELKGLLYRADGWPSAGTRFYKVTVPLK
jgi:DsbC/DsbD-like thiol-disulfide interchange protein